MSDKILYFCTVWEIFPPQFWKVFLHPAINWLRCSRPGSKPSTHPQLNPLTMDFNHFSALFTVMQSKRCHFGTVTCEKPAPNFVDMTSNIVNSNSVCNTQKVPIDSKQGACWVHMTKHLYDITFTWRNNRMTHLHDNSKAWHTGTWQLITWKAVTWLCIYINNIYVTAHWYKTHKYD